MSHSITFAFTKTKLSIVEVILEIELDKTMDQQQSISALCASAHGCSQVVRRRRTLALATAAVLASASGAAAFSPPSSTSHSACHTSQKQPSFGDESTCSSQQRQQPALNMVSFMEAPTTTTAQIPPTRKKRIKTRSKGRIRTGTPKESRSVEIDLEPFMGLDDYLTSSSSSKPKRGGIERASSRSRPNGEGTLDKNGYDLGVDSLASGSSMLEIDTEILYEGFTSTPLDQTFEEVKQSSAAASAVVTDQPTKSINDSRSRTNNKGTTPTIIEKKKKTGKSSTMPGFIKDDQLDDHIAQLGLSRITSKTSASQRQLTRMVRSKSARLRRRATNSEMMYKKSASVPDSLLDYAHEIHSISRVTPKEEKELGTRTQEAMRLQKLHDDLQTRYGRDPTDDEWCAAAGKVNVIAIQEAIEDGMRAKNQLVASNLRMVQRVVNLYIRNGLGSEYNAGDLMQDGTMALIRAAEKYEPERGFRFSTYAMYWIRSAVKRSQTSQSRIVTVPQRIHETHKRVQKNDTRLRKELGREPTKEELADACDITVLQLDRCRKAMSQVTFSLDAEVQNHHKPNSASSRKDTMYDIVEGRVDETEYERTQRLLMKEHLIGTLRRYLSPHEVDLLLLRYGLMDERALPKGMSGPLTIAEVSKLVGLKPDKVRRIIINSQKQLKHLMKEWEDFEYELA